MPFWGYAIPLCRGRRKVTDEIDGGDPIVPPAPRNHPTTETNAVTNPYSGTPPPLLVRQEGAGEAESIPL